MRVTGAVHLASCGIDVWRLQLRGRWGSNAVLRYMRLSPLAGSLALEASLGRDLRAGKEAILTAKVELAKVCPRGVELDSLQLRLDSALAPALDQSKCAGVLGKPCAREITELRTKRCGRCPEHAEILICSDDGTLHALRVHTNGEDSGDLGRLRGELAQDVSTIWELFVGRIGHPHSVGRGRVGAPLRQEVLWGPSSEHRSR